MMLVVLHESKDDMDNLLYLEVAESKHSKLFFGFSVTPYFSEMLFV